MTSQAEHPPTLQPFSSKNTSCAGTLCYPVLITVENNRFMTSQHDSSFNNTHRPCPGLHIALVVGSSATHQKSLTTGLLHHNESFSRLISKLDGTEKHDSNFGKLCIKSGSFQKERFLCVLNRQWGGVRPPKPPRAYATGLI